MNNRAQWTVVFFSIVAAVPMYGVVIWIILTGPSARPEPPSVLRVLFPLLAASLLIASSAWMVIRSRPWMERALGGSSPLPPPAEFQLGAILAVALAESSAVLGFALFLLGGPPGDFVGYAAGTLAVMLGVIGPRANAYWAAREEEQRRPPGAGGGDDRPIAR